MLWVRDHFEMIVSHRLFHELETVLLREKFRPKLSYEGVLEYVSWLRERGILADEGEEFPAFTEDPDDDYLVALALSSGAGLIVSGDRHLLELEGEGLPEVVRLAELLQVLGEN